MSGETEMSLPMMIKALKNRTKMTDKKVRQAEGMLEVIAGLAREVQELLEVAERFARDVQTYLNMIGRRTGGQEADRDLMKSKQIELKIIRQKIEEYKEILNQLAQILSR